MDALVNILQRWRRGLEDERTLKRREGIIDNPTIEIHSQLFCSSYVFYYVVVSKYYKCTFWV